MSAVLKYALLFSALWIIVRLTTFLGSFGEVYGYVLLINPLFLLLAVTFGLRASKSQSKEASSFLRDVKTGMKAGVLYALIVALFTFLYHRSIDPDFFEDRKEKVIVSLKKEIEHREKLKEEEKEVPPGTIDIEQTRQSLNTMSSPFSVMTLTLLGLITLSIIYAMVVAALDRKVLSKLGK